VTPAADVLASAMLTSDLVIYETGSVPRLRVQNRAREPLLLPSDLVVDGGKQARVVERSLIVPGHGYADVPVRCVEAGRWHAHHAHDEGTLSVSAPASIVSREHFASLKQRSLRTRRGYETDQRDVWSHVSSELRRCTTASTTQSYAAVIALRKARLQDAQRLDVRPPPDANGLALVRTGGAVWIEVLPRRADLGAIVPNIVADLLADESAAPARVASTRVKEALGAIAREPLVALPPLADTLGEPYAFDGDAIFGQALFHDGAIAHVAASVRR
jgi:hypothetical protein